MVFKSDGKNLIISFIILIPIMIIAAVLFLSIIKPPEIIWVMMIIGSCFPFVANTIIYLFSFDSVELTSNLVVLKNCLTKRVVSFRLVDIVGFQISIWGEQGLRSTKTLKTSQKTYLLMIDSATYKEIRDYYAVLTL